jgi:putative CocE/NonD family hydrolase
MRSFCVPLIVLGVSAAAAAGFTVETIYVPMRDGVRLATDVYTEASLPKAPAVLMRTPYNKSRAKGAAEKLVAAGYAVVLQDCRGANASEGVLLPYNNEGQDGYDTIEWMTRQRWSNGRVGMMGGSYVGAVQWQAAVEKPPGLVAIAPQATWSSFYRNLYLGGAVRLSLIAKWAAGNGAKPADAKPVEWDATLLHLPLSEIDDSIGWKIPWLEGFLTHPEPNGFWTRLNLTPQLPELELPALHVVGYYDFFSRESVNNFKVMREQALVTKIRQQQRLVLGPWDHGSVGKSVVGDVDFGAEAVVDTAALQLEWFDKFLKQDPAALAKPFPAVRYFSMGDNVWRDAETWPPEGFTLTPFYLRSEGNANSRSGAGRLSSEPPLQSEPPDQFRADPAAPVPATPVTPKRPLHAAVWGPVDQQATEDREDVLVYTGEVLKEPLVFAGNPVAKLFVSSNTPDADWAVKLVAVRSDGFAQNLATGILRGRFRDSLTAPSPMEPGRVYEINVDLGPVAATIPEGHRLRVDICGSLFPLYDRNPNTGAGPMDARTLVATEKVHHAPAAFSQILLPIKKH